MFNGVIYMDNIFGDIFFDILGGIVGMFGIFFSVSIVGVFGDSKCNGIYELVYGSVLDIVG